MCTLRAVPWARKVPWSHLAPGRLRPPSGTVQATSLPPERGETAPRAPSVQDRPIGRVATPGMQRRGRFPLGTVPGVAGPVAGETPSRLPQSPRRGAPAPSFHSLGIPWAPAGPAAGGRRAGVCRNERGRSRLLETNFTNEFCNN